MYTTWINLYVIKFFKEILKMFIFKHCETNRLAEMLPEEEEEVVVVVATCLRSAIQKLP